MNSSLKKIPFTKDALLSLLLGFFMLFTGIQLDGQVQFKLERLSDGKTFQVSMIPQESWSAPMNITSTAQVTIKVPTNSFEIEQLISLQSGVNWEYNSKSVAPQESPEYDYLSIGLVSLGTTSLNYEKGVAVPLFTFKNTNICQGSIALMNNDNDPFKVPNSRNANVGNSITVFGAQGEAYQESKNNSIIPCQSNVHALVVQTDESVADWQVNLYPNPAREHIFIDMQWSERPAKGEFIILDFNGRTVSKQTNLISTGANTIDINTQHLVSGLYTIELRVNNSQNRLERFVKQE